MTKADRREIDNLARYVAAGMMDTARRGGAALIRSARSDRNREEIRTALAAVGVAITGSGPVA